MSVDATRLLDRIAARIGPQHVLADPADMAGYLTESRGLYQGTALAVVRPADTGEVAFAVRECARAGVAVVAQGGNTGLVGAGVPFGGVVLSTGAARPHPRDRSRQRHHDGRGRLHPAEPCSAAPAAHDLLFPLSLPSEGSCRLGGNLATNAGGANVLRYGNTRDLVLGLEVVLADGRVWNGLKGLRKDNTGYDLKNLFVGSEGTLGIITAAVLKLVPRPKATATAFIGCASARRTLDLFQRLRQSDDDTLTAFELMPRLRARHGPEARGRGRCARSPASTQSYALIELSSPRARGGPRRPARGGARRGARGRPRRGRDHRRERGPEPARSGACARRSRKCRGSRAARSSTTSRCRSRASPISSRRRRRPAARRCRASAPCAFGHVGDGNIHFNLSQPVGMDKAAFLSRWETFNRIVHDIVAAMNGSISAEHGIGLIKRDELLRYKDPVALDLMRTLKRALDPQNILNPGKVIAVADDAPAALPVAKSA